MAIDPAAAATLKQRKAADPSHSVILGASAGSGKTKVLVDRFLRLCIEEKTVPCHPRAILAITFTKKASVEIRERLLEQAAAMAMMPEADLKAALIDLFLHREIGEPTRSEMKSAAGLYEKILEDVTALNVSTIHSFCQQILSRFATEAGLDPHFSVLENTDELQEEALDQLELESIKKPELEAAAALVAKDPQSVRRAMGELFKEQMRIERWIDRIHALEHNTLELDQHRQRVPYLAGMVQEIKTFLFPQELYAANPTAELTAANWSQQLADGIRVFLQTAQANISEALGGEWDARLETNVRTLTDKLDALLPMVESGESYDRLGDVFLTKSGKTSSFTGIRNDPDLKARFNELVVEEALPILESLQTYQYLGLYQTNVAFLILGLRLLDIFEGLKRRDRVVDFNDLEDTTRRLMSSPGQVDNLLYRLDDSMRHLLIDEFQDTNYSQWDIVGPFVREFLSGNDGPARTVFFVGDVKQSIYGFRGAEPGLFPLVEKMIEKYGLSLNLPTNFRSQESVVDGVGYLFTKGAPAQGLHPQERAHVWQKWIRNEDPGEVRIIREFADLDPDDGDGRSGDQLAAAAAVGQVLHLIEGRTVTWDWDGSQSRERPLQWNDILVLCRTRTAVSIYEKAFREAGIPIVPPGRGMLAASREVQDLLALMRWLVWPEDDAALACVLRSPIFRMAEKQLQELLAARGLDRTNKDGKTIPPRTLWQTLREATTVPDLVAASEMLKTWRKHLGHDNCHGLLRRIYAEGNVLQRYQVGMGDQARYNLMRLYDLTLSPEVAGTPTVRKFISYIDRAALKGAEDEGTLPEAGGGGRVRFMTVHGAKGLEAPVVILVDADKPPQNAGDVLRMDQNSLATGILFKVNSKMRRGFELPSGMNLRATDLKRASTAADARAVQEETNLLYVALTRARDRVILIGGEKPRHQSSPLQQLATAARTAECSVLNAEDPLWLLRPPVAGQVWQTGSASHGLRSDTKQWQPPVMGARFKTITPSTAEGSLPVVSTSTSSSESGNRADAMARGDEVHLLLQLAADTGSMPAGSGANWDEAAVVFGNPALDWVFRPQSFGNRGLSEVPVIHRTGKTNDNQVESRTYGIIDRLVIKPDRIDIIDYKTNRTGYNLAARKKLADHYRPQLSAYKNVVLNLFPNRDVHTWLLFTEPPPSGGEGTQFLEILLEVPCDG